MTGHVVRSFPIQFLVAPLKRADIAHLAVFLASNRTKNITGQTLDVDGGQVMHGQAPPHQGQGLGRSAKNEGDHRVRSAHS
jgi:hypothetical protein